MQIIVGAKVRSRSRSRSCCWQWNKKKNLSSIEAWVLHWRLAIKDNIATVTWEGAQFDLRRGERSWDGDWREEYLFLLCGDICQEMVRTGAFFPASLSVSSTGLCKTEDTLTDWESTWRSQTKFCIFFHRYSSTEISTIKLSEVLMILKYVAL